VLTVGRLVRRAQGAKFQFVCVAKPDGSRAPSVHDLLKCINCGVDGTLHLQSCSANGLFKNKVWPFLAEILISEKYC
jgi:hypothetical protein